MKRWIKSLGVLFLLLVVAFLVSRAARSFPPEKEAFAKLKRPLNIAHRGGMDLWPENTIYGFKKAVQLGVDVLEFDVHPTADGRIVVIHDDRVDRTSNGSGYVDHMTLAELKMLDFAWHFIPPGEDFPPLRGKGISIPTLEEVFLTFPDSYFNIEIKTDSGPFTQQVIRMIHDFHMTARVLLASFYGNTLHSSAAGIPVAAGPQEVRTLVILNKLSLQKLHDPLAAVYEVPLKNEGTEIVTDSFIEAAHEKGQEVYVWTIDDSVEMRRLLMLGVDGIITNRPDRLNRIRHKVNIIKECQNPLKPINSAEQQDFGSEPEQEDNFAAQRCPSSSGQPFSQAGILPFSHDLSVKQNKSTLKKIDKIYILIHAFCYTDIASGMDTSKIDPNLKKYLARENSCAGQWRARLKEFADNELLLIIPWPGKKQGPVSEFNELACKILGTRCLILDCPDGNDAAFWSETGSDFDQALLAELKSALLYQNDRWDQEELHTAFHSLACCRKLADLITERGFTYDRSNVKAEAWGASFEGCVTKYSITLRRMLQLSEVIKIDFNLTVPDALYLLNAECCESLLPAENWRLFLFKAADRFIALYSQTSQSLRDQPASVKLKCGRGQLIIRSKQDIRLWPDPEDYPWPSTAGRHCQPVQQLVRYEADHLTVPVTAGFVYRLEKAPAYIFAGPDLSYGEFKEILLTAELVSN